MTKQELFTKVTGLTFDVEKITDPVKLAWLIPDGAMLDNAEGSRFEITKEFMSAAGIDVDGKVALIIESTKGNENPKAKPSGKGWKKVVDVEAVEGQEAVAEYWVLDGTQYNEDPTFSTLDVFEVISDEESWNASFENGVLKLYYAANPSEDLWNNTTNKAASYNDRHYEGTIDGEAVEANVAWASSAAQKLTIDGVDYYAAIFYDFTLRELPLFNDVALTESANKTFVMTAGYYVGCEHSYQGWIANGAQTPWICVDFTDADANVKIIFRYDGNDVYPWGDKVFGNGEGHKAWGIASLPTECGGTDTSKLQIILEKQGVEYHEAVPAVEAVEEQYHWEREVVKED